MSLIDTLEPGLSGLDQIKAMIVMGGAPPMAKTLDFALVEAEAGRVVFEGAPSQAVYNPLGAVHGGYAAALLDSACGCAVHTRLGPAQGYTTLELKVSYHKAMTDRTGLVRAEGLAITVGRRAAFAEAKITDAAGRLYATATSTLLVFDR